MKGDAEEKILEWSRMQKIWNCPNNNNKKKCLHGLEFKHSGVGKNVKFLWAKMNLSIR